MINLSNKLIVGLLICMSFLFGDMVKRTYFPVTTTVVQPATVLTDSLSLANKGSVEIKLVDGKKLVIFSLEDLKYITKKKKVTRKTVKSLEMLFKRFEN